MELMNAKDYENAKYAFSMMGDYKDSEEQYKECVYQIACAYYDKKDLDNSNPLFEEIKGYKDSAEKIHYHDWKETKKVDPTCEKKGSKELTCSCGETKTEDVAALGHDYSDATCTKPRTCKRCKATSGSALGHTDGVKCERCGKVLFETLKYSGTGKKYIRGINLPEGQFLVKCTYRGESNFVVYICKYDGSASKLLANEIDSCNTEYQLNLDGIVTDAYIDVRHAEGSWTITIEAL